MTRMQGDSTPPSMPSLQRRRLLRGLALLAAGVLLASALAGWLLQPERAGPYLLRQVGDALFPAPAMPKSGHMANQHGKVAAAAILNLFKGLPPNPTPVVMNTCYSFVDAKNVIHVASVHQFDAEKRQPIPVDGAGGVSSMANELEGKSALAWARNIWADMLA